MEIMVVVAIIGLVTAVTLIKMSSSSRDSQLDEEAERMEALFAYVREQAELQTRDYGLRIDDQKYSFVVYDILGDEWREADEDDALREREFPADIEPAVVVEGRKIILDSREKKIQDFTPQVLIFANGDISSFEVMLQRKGVDDNSKRARLYTDEQSNVMLLLPGQVEQKNPPVRAAAVTR